MPTLEYEDPYAAATDSGNHDQHDRAEYRAHSRLAGGGRCVAATMSVTGVFIVLNVTLGADRLADAVGLVVAATSIAMLAAYLLGVPVALMLERRFADRPVLRLVAYVVAGLAAGALVGLWFGRDGESLLWCSARGMLAALTGALAARWAQHLSPQRARLTSRWASVALMVALAAAWFPIATSGGPAQ